MSSPSCASHNHITYWVDAVTHEAPPSGQGLLGCVALPCSLYPPGQDEQWVSSCGSHLSEYCTAECSHNTQPATGKASEDYVCLGSPSCPRSASSCWVDATTHEPPPENPHTGQKVGFLGCHQCSLDPPGQHEVWHDSCDATIYTGNCMAECAPGYESSIRQTTAYYLCRPDAECRHNIDPHLRHEFCWLDEHTHEHSGLNGALQCTTVNRCTDKPPGSREMWQNNDCMPNTGSTCSAVCTPGYESNQSHAADVAVVEYECRQDSLCPVSSIDRWTGRSTGRYAQGQQEPLIANRCPPATRRSLWITDARASAPEGCKSIAAASLRARMGTCWLATGAVRETLINTLLGG